MSIEMLLYPQDACVAELSRICGVKKLVEVFAHGAVTGTRQTRDAKAVC